MNQSPKTLAVCQKLLFGGAIASLTVGAMLSPALSSSVKSNLEDNPKRTVDEVWQIVNNEFVDPDFNHVEWQAKRKELLSRHYGNRTQAYKAIREALKDLGDPYTRFLIPDEFTALTTQTSGELSGVGIRMSVEQRTKDLIVVDVLKNSPAMKAGVKNGDRIIKINGKPTALMNIEQASQEIQGEVGSVVSVQLSRKGKGVFELSLTRTQIEIPTVSYNIKQEEQMKVGYIRLDEFSSHAAEQMKQAIDDLTKQKASAFVLDLRGNPGGLLFASVDIARMWMKQGSIVSTVDRRGGDRRFAANGTALTDRPLVILVNEGSASASEILAGALKENRRATLVGTTTYGKGTVQSVHSLSDGSGLAVTIAHYYPPSGTNINKKGIQPDVEISLTMEQQLQLRNDPSLLGTSADPQYKRAIAVIKTNSFSQKTAPQLPRLPISSTAP
jgi:carboxyl-terminal processing protease